MEKHLPHCRPPTSDAADQRMPHEIKLYKELANHKKNLEEQCTPETFNFYITRINSMALSLESVLARRRANKFRNSYVTNSNITATKMTLILTIFHMYTNAPTYA